MTIGNVVLHAVLSACWICGLISQMDSREALMRYLACSMVLLAAVVWSKAPVLLRRRRFRDRGGRK